MAIYGSDGTREVTARKAYGCAQCGGTIDHNEHYLNYHTDHSKGNWQGRVTWTVTQLGGRVMPVTS